MGDEIAKDVKFKLFSTPISNIITEIAVGLGIKSTLAPSVSLARPLFYFFNENFRKVADPGNENHPLILREMGKNWGFGSIPANPLSDFFGGMVRGAPGIGGLIDRNITDKLRIGKFVLSLLELILVVMIVVMLNSLIKK